MIREEGSFLQKTCTNNAGLQVGELNWRVWWHTCVFVSSAKIQGYLKMFSDTAHTVNEITCYNSIHDIVN